MGENTLHFFISGYNQEKYILKTFERLKKIINETNLEDYKIYISNDGSKDNTKEEILKILEIDKEVVFFDFEKNIGLNKTIEFFLNKNLPGKFTHIPGDDDLDDIFLRNLIITSFKADFVSGFFINKEYRSAFRNILSSIYNTSMCFLFGVYVNYLQGPGVWPIKLVNQIKIHTKEICFWTELNIKLLRSDITYTETFGYMNRPITASTSLSISSFIEVFKVLKILIKDIYFGKNYKNKAKRIIIDD